MSEFEISLLCSSVISYYQVQNGISPVKRLYVRNASDFDCENIEISVSSKPDFLLPVSEIQAVFPARANLRFDGIAKLSPLYMVAQNRKHDGEITVQVLKDGVVLEEATERVTVLAFDECNVDKPESIATFVRRTPDVNRLLNLAHKKIAEWGFKDVTGTGYANASKNKVRNLCAATYAVLCDYGFLMGKKTTADSVIVSDFSEILSDKVATPMELALIFASVIESISEAGTSRASLPKNVWRKTCSTICLTSRKKRRRASVKRRLSTFRAFSRAKVLKSARKTPYRSLKNRRPSILRSI